MIREDDYIFRESQPPQGLADFVKYCWYVHNPGEKEHHFTIFPDGHFDLLFRSRNGSPFTAVLSGIFTKEFSCVVPPASLIFGVSFRLPAAEYIWKRKIGDITDREEPLPAGFWKDVAALPFDFSLYAARIMTLLQQQITKPTDPRKQQLFRLLYGSNGNISVEEAAETCYWSTRQINRYFAGHFGMSFKAFSNILRYRASFEQLKQGNLYPEQPYADQAHFIREVRKYSGITPKEIAANKNGGFIQLSTLREN
ncbi:helix-turn-helix domain-containing protein [Chitinophaga solisilvae]|uniref:helix-turn-helix domain-containing protein n=1 Tax=Chitinophaga solisilvae TaxID=1233460 RepID=UPI0013691026|nr:AraC family transcriptional regulator [Chitinophaga solisilvae]